LVGNGCCKPPIVASKAATCTAPLPASLPPLLLLSLLLLAAAVFCPAGIVTTPLDVLKTRLMTQGTSGRYKNLIDATTQVCYFHSKP
jgi:hypothetical protein